jgi:AcrR family transcriptional regulator
LHAKDSDSRIEEIAQQAQASKSAIYFHFPSKERLFLALADQFANLLERRVVEAVAGHTGGMLRVRAALETCLNTFGRYRRAAKIMLAQGAGLGAFSMKNGMQSTLCRLIAGYLRKLLTRAKLRQ